MSQFNERMKLKILANRQPVSVQVRPVPKWCKEADEVIDDYQLKLLAMKERIDRMLRLLKILEIFEDSVHWDRLRRLLDLLVDSEDKLDFVKEAILYGIEIRRAFKVPFTRNRRLKRIFNLMIGPHERRRCEIITFSRTYLIQLPPEHEHWVGGAQESQIVI